MAILWRNAEDHQRDREGVCELPYSTGIGKEREEGEKETSHWD